MIKKVLGVVAGIAMMWLAVAVETIPPRTMAAVDVVAGLTAAVILAARMRG